MKKLNNTDNFMTETGLYEQQMIGYKDGEYTLQTFVACKGCWFYVLIYNVNDELIGVATFIIDSKETVYKIKYAKNIKLVMQLLNKLIAIKKEEYRKENAQ